MTKLIKTCGIAVSLFGLLYLASFVFSSPIAGLEDGDNPAASLAFLKQHGNFYFLSGLASSLAAELKASVVLDLGCGTGLLARELAAAGRTVIGLDPAPAMLAHARRQPGAERVQWVEGGSSALGTPNADLVLMSGNVAQVFLEDADWTAALGDIHTALRPGGCLAFESRNPEDRAWERWNRPATFQRSNTPHGPLEEWLELLSVEAGKVCFAGHNRFTDTGEVLAVRSELRFRSQEEWSSRSRLIGSRGTPD